jgi:hypothetical protein
LEAVTQRIQQVTADSLFFRKQGIRAMEQGLTAIAFSIGISALPAYRLWAMEVEFML